MKKLKGLSTAFLSLALAFSLTGCVPAVEDVLTNPAQTAQKSQIASGTYIGSYTTTNTITDKGTGGVQTNSGESTLSASFGENGLLMTGSSEAKVGDETNGNWGSYPTTNVIQSITITTDGLTVRMQTTIDMGTIEGIGTMVLTGYLENTYRVIDAHSLSYLSVGDFGDSHIFVHHVSQGTLNK